MRQTLFYFHISLSIPICRPWASLGNTVFMQIVSSYNYERLIRSISTPFCLPIICTYIRTSILTYIFTPLLLIPSIRTPLFYPSLLIRSIRTYIRTPLFLLPLLLLPLFLLPTTLPSICTHNMYTFFSKNFSQKIGTLKAYPKIFPKFLLIWLLPLIIFQ